MRVGFQEDLDHLESSIHEEGTLVLRSLRGALNALVQQDEELADEVIAFDDEIDARYLAVEEGVQELLARRLPSRPTSGSCFRCSTSTCTSNGSATTA